jgi:hypothetical protein
VLPSADPVQVGQQDRHDHARFDALTKKDDERGEHLRSSQPWRFPT